VTLVHCDWRPKQIVLVFFDVRVTAEDSYFVIDGVQICPLRRRPPWRSPGLYGRVDHRSRCWAFVLRSWWNGESKDNRHISWNWVPTGSVQSSYWCCQRECLTGIFAVLRNREYLFLKCISFIILVKLCAGENVELCVFLVLFIETRLLVVCWSRQSIPGVKFYRRFACLLFIRTIMLIFVY